MTAFDRLGQEIAREQDALRAQALHRARVREKIDGVRIPARASPMRRALLAGGVATAAALVAALWLPLSKRPLHRALAAYAARSGEAIAVGAWIEASGTEAFAIRFSDGTHLEIAAHTRARLVAIDANGAHLLLESGRARLQVTHRPHARWRVSAGPFAVGVVGTRFDVQWNPEQDQFELDLAQGAVDVSGCAFGQGYRMRAGQRLVASCKRGRFDISDAARSTPAVDAGLAGEAEPTGDDQAAAQSAIATSVRQGRSARAPALRGGASMNRVAPALRGGASMNGIAPALRGGASMHAAAHKSAEGRALADEFEAKCANASIEELASLADAAHYAGEREHEADAWRLLRQRFPGTSRAALAAFSLGRLEFDVHGSYPKAAEWFGTYLKEQPAGALVREARGRLMEATLRAGDARAARTLAAAYLRDYPAGPHADLARSLARAPSP